MRLVLGVGLVTLLFCALCAGQSLGDAARQNRQQKEASGTTAKKVYTTDGVIDPASALVQYPGDMSGTWNFTHFDDRYQGWITLRQSGSTLQGTWHTSRGKSEPDTAVSGSVHGTAVTLWRSLGPNQQSYALTLSVDGSRLDGFGEGYFLHHTNLNMTRSAATKAATDPASTTRKGARDASPAMAANLSGLWTFTLAGGQFQGTVALHDEGADFTGIWHTAKGKTEPDSNAWAHVDGHRVTLRRFIGNETQNFVLTLSEDRGKLDGYGEGWFLNHTDISLVRVDKANP